MIVTFHKNMIPEEYSFISEHFTGVVIKAEATFFSSTLFTVILQSQDSTCGLSNISG